MSGSSFTPAFMLQACGQQAPVEVVREAAQTKSFSRADRLGGLQGGGGRAHTWGAPWEKPRGQGTEAGAVLPRRREEGSREVERRQGRG